MEIENEELHEYVTDLVRIIKKNSPKRDDNSYPHVIKRKGVIIRLQDLKRWGKLYNKGVSFERKPQTSSLAEGSSLKITYDNPLFVWPIPQHEIEAPGSEVLPNESNK